ncbi:MAG: sugar phosphate isomerase/epimerase [Clostridiales bacterium]|mgnify:CR=1 FL=1|nr:sugar phosphate isomerase/epimerase [Clostridiales bacterium]
MKIGFSTLGCPEWSWKEIVAAAKDLGYDGIELRGVGNEMYMPKAQPFTPENIQSTKSMLDELGLEIPCITSACYLFKEDVDRYISEGKDYIDIASKLQSPYIRVLGDRHPHPGEDIDHGKVASALDELGEYAKDRGVMVLIESNGVYANSRTLLALLEGLKSDNIGIVWDIHHPYRFMNEDIEDTYERLKGFIRHVHVKDSICVDDKVKYCLLGQGDIPLEQALELLKADGYKGYLSLEWVRRWYYGLEEPGIVFPHFIYTVKDMLENV